MAQLLGRFNTDMGDYRFPRRHKTWLLTNEGVDLGIGHDLAAGLDFITAIFLESGLIEDPASQAHAGAKLFPVIWMRHVIEVNYRGLFGIGRVQPDRAARFRPHRPDMGLKAMTAGRRIAVIIHAGHPCPLCLLPVQV